MNWRNAIRCVGEATEHIALSVICLLFAVYAVIMCGICKLCGIDLEEDFE